MMPDAIRMSNWLVGECQDIVLTSRHEPSKQRNVKLSLRDKGTSPLRQDTNPSQKGMNLSGKGISYTYSETGINYPARLCPCSRISLSILDAIIVKHYTPPANYEVDRAETY